LVLVTGPPGTGKSTLAETAAAELDAAVLAWDWTMAGLRQVEPVWSGFQALDRVSYLQVGWSVLWNLGVAQLRAGRSVVLDGLARASEVAVTRARAADAGARCVVVVTACTDSKVHRARVEGRRRAIPGWHELEWDSVVRTSARWQPPTDADLVLDAAADLSSNQAALIAALA
jgi:predicted kinase